LPGLRRTLVVACLASAVVLAPVGSAAGWRVALAGAAAVALAVAVLATWARRQVVEPLADIAAEVAAASPDDARRRVVDLHHAEGRCRTARDRLADLLEDLSSSLGEGLMVVSSDLKIRLVNPVALRFCGADAVRLDTQLLEILRNPDAVRLVEEAAAGETPSSAVVENPRGLWELRAFPVRLGGAVVLVSDVSTVRRAAEFRRRFVQDLSHELRSPLAVLRTTVEAVEDEVPPRLVEILVRQVERLDRLTRELYELATLEAGQVELQLESVILGAVVAEVLNDFSPEAERVGVTLRQHCEPDLLCHADRRGLYRVLSNLVDNAIKYNRDGGWVEVRGRARGSEIVLEVEDSGAGIPAGELHAVLQRFYRLDRARTPGRGGLGLGLAIVKHMVQHLGGRLQLDSREGVGTTVTVAFPKVDPTTA
jgi:two-component system phosphate regulon sensor histidine kinase PhoR